MNDYSNFIRLKQAQYNWTTEPSNLKSVIKAKQTPTFPNQRIYAIAKNILLCGFIGGLAVAAGLAVWKFSNFLSINPSDKSINDGYEHKHPKPGQHPFKLKIKKEPITLPKLILEPLDFKVTLCTQNICHTFIEGAGFDNNLDRQDEICRKAPPESILTWEGRKMDSFDMTYESDICRNKLPDHTLLHAQSYTPIPIHESASTDKLNETTSVLGIMKCN